MSESIFYEEVAPDGDVVLIIGPHQVRLCVHSTVLQTASKVFKAMLGPHFSEGQKPSQVDSKRPREIPLPEDDADIIIIICAVIHHQNDIVPDDLIPSEILQLSVVIDKYDCTIALKYAIDHWLDHRNVENLKELMDLMTAAYLFDHAEAFSKITFTMMMEHSDSYLPFAKDHVIFGLPWELFCESIENEQLCSSVDIDDRFTRRKTKLNTKAIKQHFSSEARVPRLCMWLQRQDYP